MKQVFLTEKEEIKLSEERVNLMDTAVASNDGKELSKGELKKIEDIITKKEKDILKIKKTELLRMEAERKANISKTINDFVESNGQLSDKEDKSIILNLNTGNYVMIHDNNMRDIPAGNDALRTELKLYFPSVPFEQIKKEIPGAYVEFDLRKKKITKDKDGRATINLFDIDKTQLNKVLTEEQRNELREEGGLNTTTDFIKKYKHFNILFNNVYHKDNVDYVINWISTVINSPEKIRTTLLLKTPQRTGKNLLVNTLFKWVFGDDYVAGNIDNSNAVHSRNLIYKDKRIAIFNEVEFKPGSGAEAKLKSIITDDTIIITEMGQKPVEHENLMACQFFTQNDQPFKIEGDDDRYSVFDTRAKGVEKLRVVLERDYDMTTDEFVVELEKERDGLLMDFVLHDYDVNRANKPVVNNDKDIMSRRTETKEETIKRLLLSANYEDIHDSLVENYEMLIDLNKIVPNNSFLVKLNNLYESMSVGILTSKDITFIYEYYLADGQIMPSTTKIGKMFSSMVGMPRKRNGNKIRVLPCSYKGERIKYNNILNKDISFEEKKTLNQLIEESTLKEEVKEELTSETNYMSNDEFVSTLKEKAEDNFIIDSSFKEKGFCFYKHEIDGKVETFITQDLDKELIEYCDSLVVPF